MRRKYPSRIALGLAACGAIALTAMALTWATLVPSLASEEPFIIPAPRSDIKAEPAGLQTIILAGGCFWGVQGVYQHTRGVVEALSGYAGGSERTAHYESVGTGTTGHAEAVKVTYDPRQISYGKILQIYFSVVHDPTQLNRQGPDTGTQYRSTIFTSSAEDRTIAEDYIGQLNAAKVYKKPIVTTIEPMKGFYPAEDYHQDYLTRHPKQPYIVINDLPKIENLKKVFAASYRDKPVLVFEAKAGNRS